MSVPDTEGYLGVWIVETEGAPARQLVGGFYDGNAETWFASLDGPIIPAGRDTAIRLLITDMEDRPLAGAAVRLVTSFHASAFDGRPRVLTGSDGLVDILPLERDYLADITREGFAPVRFGSRQWPLDLEDVRQHVRLTPGAPVRIELGETLKGRPTVACVLTYEDPVSRARCEWGVTPDAKGVVEFVIPKGSTATFSIEERDTVLQEGRIEAGSTVRVERRP